MRRGGNRWGVALLVIGIALASIGGVLGRRGSRLRPGPTQPVTDDARLAINTNTSPLVVADPRRPEVLVAVGRIDAPQLNCSVSVSASGGEAWRRLALPLPVGATNCFWPDVAFAGDGSLLVVYTPTSGPFQLPDSLQLQRFTPEFAPDGPPTRIAGALTFQPRMTADARRVLVTWVQADPARADKSLGFPPPPNPVLVARSDDSGRSFSAPVTVSEPGRLAVQPSVLALPGNRVLIGALDLVDDRDTYETTDQGLPGPPPTRRWRIVAWISDDTGRSFSPATVVADPVIPVQRELIDLAPAPAFAQDGPRNRTYAAWASDGHVLLSRSDDGGLSWAAPRRLPAGSPAPRADQGGQLLPGIGVSAGGRVDVGFYDRSRDPGHVRAEVVLASSSDGGQTFSTAVVSEQPFDATVGSLNGDTVMLGSHLAVVAQADRSTVVWADTARGNRVNNIVDLAAATVVIEADSGRTAARQVLVAGVLLAVVGFALIARTWPARGAAPGRSSSRRRGAWRRRSHPG